MFWICSCFKIALLFPIKNKLQTWFKSMKLSFKESSFLTDVKSLLRVLRFLFLLDISCLSNLIWHCLYAIEFLKSLLETQNWTNYGMMLFLRQVFKKSVSSNTFLCLKSSFSNSLTFLAMTSPYLFRKTLMVDKCLGKWRRTRNKNIIDTAFRNTFES